MLTSFEGPLFLRNRRNQSKNDDSEHEHPAAAFPILVRRLASGLTVENVSGEIESPPVTTAAPH